MSADSASQAARAVPALLAQRGLQASLERLAEEVCDSVFIDKKPRDEFALGGELLGSHLEGELAICGVAVAGLLKSIEAEGKQDPMICLIKGGKF